MKQVKFYDAGGHSGAGEFTDAPGLVVSVSKERYASIKNDPSDTLRSPFGTPVWYDPIKG